MKKTSGARNARRTRAGYSGTPLAVKLGIKGGGAVALVGAPDGFEEFLEGLPGDASVEREARGRGGSGGYDVIVLFAPSVAVLEKKFGAQVGRLAVAGGLWVAWPKKASGVSTDLTEDAVRALGLKSGLVDNKVCAISEVWSGLRFVRRVKDRGR